MILYSAPSKTGPFTVVPNGSAVMSPMNRTNPDLSETDGHFGWDVIAGFYKVRAEKSGCHAPGAGQPFVETAVQNIPPPVTDLDIRLECPLLAGVSVKPPLVPLRVLLSLPRRAVVKVGKDGKFEVRSAQIACPSASQGACKVDVGVIATLPHPKKKSAKKSQANRALKLGASSLSVLAGKTAALKGKLSKMGLHQLEKLGRLKAKISISAEVPAGEASATSLDATLLPPPKKLHRSH